MSSETRPHRYREIEVAGSTREMGHQIGEAAREEIRGFCEIALERVRKTTPISAERAIQVARASGEFAEKYDREVMDEIRGMAESASVTVDDLMLLQVRNQLQPDQDAGCTALSIPATDKGDAIVAQTWDNDPALDPFTVVLTRRPSNRPAFMTCTQAGLVSYLGFNAAGIGACVNTLPAPSREVGVPHYFTLRNVYAATSLDEAVSAVQRAHRAIPANIMLATPQGPADLEVTIEKVFVLTLSDANWLSHSNHCLHPELAQVNKDFPELIQSYPRKRCIDRLLQESRQPIDVPRVQQILADHENHPTSICRHANEQPQHGFWETVFSIIIEPGKQQMHVSRGTPCDHPFETYCLK